MNVLFLCTGNSARSILGEVILRDCFDDHKTYSAGSNPVGQVNPLAMETLKTHGHDTSNLQSQNVTEFTDHDIDLVISVCDNAANDCTVWPGKGNPQRLHWPLPDPETRENFEHVYQALKDKISDFISTL